MAASLIALGTLALRCNTYLGTDVTSSGAGIETCVVPINHCVQKEYWFFGVRTYSMECDDLLQCLSVPPGECCTKSDSSMRYPTVVRCSTTNFNETTLNLSNFGPECKRNCSTHGARRELQPMTLGALAAEAAPDEERGSQHAARARARARARAHRLVEELAPLALVGAAVAAAVAIAARAVRRRRAAAALM